MRMRDEFGAPERKFHRPETGLVLSEGSVIEGYASIFGRADNGGDVVARGAYAASLEAMRAQGRRAKMLWQHDPAEVIGVWDEVHEDETGLWVRGHILPEIGRGREAAALIAAKALDGLSIGYRTVRAEWDAKGRRVLTEIELWEVSLVTFPMLPEARVAAKGEDRDGLDWQDIADLFEGARRSLSGG